MGGRVTVFENRAAVDMEIRVFVPPARPDRYRMIIRVKPGEVRKVLTKRLCNCNEYFPFPSEKTDNYIFLMVFMDGTYTGVTLLPWEVKKYAKIIGYYMDDCHVILKGVRCTFTTFFRLK
uniref:Uncharacterized protein n=1 Tax=Lactuca sativa TaxID=4236 RepID=A0A9R1WL25_LACSA|nr:hypothetical protein LSAT_V11C100018840 [Lactuca sativa]